MKCIKCGSKDISTSYHKCADYLNCWCSYGSHNTSTEEHLHKYCRNCQYDWVVDIWDISSEITIGNN